MGSLILNMMASLAVVLGLMAAVAWAASRFLGVRPASNRSPVEIEVLSHRSLQPKRSLFVVRIGGALYLLASGDHELSLVSELKDAALLQAVEAQRSQGTPEGRIVLNAADLIGRLRKSGPVFLKRHASQQ